MSVGVPLNLEGPARQVTERPESEKWAAVILAAYSRTAEGIIETGRLLVEAKTALEHGRWEAMVEEKLPFSIRTAERLMDIGRDRRLVKPSILPLLPAHWTKIHKLHQLDDAAFEKRIENLETINGARAIMGSRHEPDDSLDFFPTPPWATRALMECVFPLLEVDPDHTGSLAWEPACGEGHIAEVLREYWPRVMVSDIFNYGYAGTSVADFTKDQDVKAAWIITNPPFGDLTEQFALQAIKVAEEGVALFVRLQWLESVGRYDSIFRDYPPTLIAFFAERVPLCKGQWNPEGTTATAYVWLVWMKDKQPLPPFWIPPGQREKLTKPDDVLRFTCHPVASRKSGESSGEGRK